MILERNLQENPSMKENYLLLGKEQQTCLHIQNHKLGKEREKNRVSVTLIMNQ